MHLSLPHPAQSAVAYALRHPIRALRERRGSDEQVGEFYDPDFDFFETPNGYSVIADVPGMRERDLDIRFEDGAVVVAGSREAEQEIRDAQLMVQERSWGGFARSFPLPEDADANLAEATLEEGVLTVRIPRKPGVPSVKIPVRQA